jgi:glucose dehydrogenase
MRNRISLALAVALVIALAACTGDDGGGGRTDSATPTTTAEPPDSGWTLPGADLDNSRTATGSSIDLTTVGALAVAWQTEIIDAGQLATVPVVRGETVYVQGTAGVVAALELATGATNWVNKGAGPTIGPTGAAVDPTRVYALHGSTGVMALDAATGKQVWSRDIAATDTVGVDIQPLVHDGVVYVSTVPVSLRGIYTGGDRGIIHALDAETGEDRWTFDTVEGPTDGPDALWGNAAVNSGGGSWYPPAIDEDRGVVYFGVANPAPFPGTAEFPNGSSRPGPNLYTNSLVALDIATGRLRWYHQVFPHDLFDRDQVHALIARLPDADVVVSAGKGGVIVGLDPDSGEVLWRTPVGVHRNDDREALAGPTEMWPGSFGGVITPPATADGIVYAVVLNSPTTMKPNETSYFASELGTMDSEAVAVEASTGKVLWTTPLGGDSFGAAAVVNDLVLTTRLDGTLLALDRETGEIVHEVELGGQTNGWLSVAGDTVLVPMNDPARVVAIRPS